MKFKVQCPFCEGNANDISSIGTINVGVCFDNKGKINNFIFPKKLDKEYEHEKLYCSNCNRSFEHVKITPVDEEAKKWDCFEALEKSGKQSKLSL